MHRNSCVFSLISLGGLWHTAQVQFMGGCPEHPAFSWLKYCVCFELETQALHRCRNSPENLNQYDTQFIFVNHIEDRKSGLSKTSSSIILLHRHVNLSLVIWRKLWLSTDLHLGKASLHRFKLRKAKAIAVSSRRLKESSRSLHPAQLVHQTTAHIKSKPKPNNNETECPNLCKSFCCGSALKW